MGTDADILVANICNVGTRNEKKSVRQEEQLFTTFQPFLLLSLSFTLLFPPHTILSHTPSGLVQYCSP